MVDLFVVYAKKYKVLPTFSSFKPASSRRHLEKVKLNIIRIRNRTRLLHFNNKQTLYLLIR